MVADHLRYQIQPVVKRPGINKRVSWHTFRRTYTSLLHANGEGLKDVQELLRHGSGKITMERPCPSAESAKRRAQQKVVEMVRREAAPEAMKWAHKVGYSAGNRDFRGLR